MSLNMKADTDPKRPQGAMARILLVSGEEAASDEIKTLVGSSWRVIVNEVEAGKIGEELSADSTDLVVVNLKTLTDNDAELLSNIRSVAPMVPMIVTSDLLSPDQTRRLFRYNVHDWLQKPIDGKDLMDSILKGVRTQTGGSSNRVHAVVSCVGGAGATTLALSMTDIAATTLYRKSSVALFDLDFSLGDCGYLVNMTNAYNLANVAATPRRVDAEFIQLIQQKHEHNFYLYSFKRPELNSEINGYELVLRMLDAVSMQHEQTFLDIPYYETDWKDDVLRAVNTCTLVSETNLPAIKHTLDMVERIKKLRGETFPVQVIFNKWESSLFNQRIGRKKLKELFGDVPFHFMPNARTQIGEAVDRGVLPSVVAKRSRLLKALRKYMTQLKQTQDAA